MNRLPRIQYSRYRRLCRWFSGFTSAEKKVLRKSSFHHAVKKMEV